MHQLQLKIIVATSHTGALERNGVNRRRPEQQLFTTPRTVVLLGCADGSRVTRWVSGVVLKSIKGLGKGIGLCAIVGQQVRV
jgi:hypothetical protein